VGGKVLEILKKKNVSKKFPKKTFFRKSMLVFVYSWSFCFEKCFRHVKAYLYSLQEKGFKE
jgi:hypothetical protein